MNRRTKIICTLGPASSAEKVILRMARAGMDVARINFSHGQHSQHQKLIDTVRKVNRRLPHPIKILQDLEGYRIRVGYMPRPVILKKGQTIWVSNILPGSKDLLPLDTQFEMASLKKGMDIYIADGVIALKVLGLVGHKAKCRVIQGGLVTSKKGINIIGLRLKANILTPKDIKDIEFGIKNNVDFVAQSFVRNQKDVARVVDLVKPYLPKVKVIAKIENRDGLKNLRKILMACDGIMVARGDLGVSLPIYQVPMYQKQIIKICGRKHKMDITATQMLESMTDHLRPTRAEVSDVANAILDGSDYVMLSGETAVGRYPVETVDMMRQIIEFTEKFMKKASTLQLR